MTPRFEWSDSLEIGLPSLDAQHKQIFAISNNLMTAIARGEGETGLKETFQKLKEYTESHFREEEAFMEQIGFPQQADHAEEHTLLLVRVNTIWRLISSGDAMSPKALSLFLSDWISDHIMHRDMQIADFTKSKA